MGNLYCSTSSCTLTKRGGGLTCKQENNIQKYSAKNIKWQSTAELMQEMFVRSLIWLFVQNIIGVKIAEVVIIHQHLHCFELYTYNNL